MITIYGKSTEQKRDVTLFIESTLEDFLADELLSLSTDKAHPIIEEYFKLSEELSSEYWLTVRVCCFSAIEYSPVIE